MQPRFPFVAVDVRAERVDELCALLFELGAQGIEQRDDLTHPGQADWAADDASDGEAGELPRLRVAWSDVEGAGGQLRPLEDRQREVAEAGASAETVAVVTLLASFGDRGDAELALAELRSLEPDLPCRVGEVVGDPWRERYRETLAPFELTPSIIVAPPWAGPESMVQRAGARVLRLDPGRAFGTGLHPTTALVAQELDRRADELRGRALLDVGTGSGILALVGVLCGAERAVGVDTDADAVAVAQGNAARNGLDGQVELHDTPVGEVAGQFPWVVANIELRVLVELAPAVCPRVAAGGGLILSGLLEEHHAEAVARYRAVVGPSGARFEVEQLRRREADRDTWVVVVLRRVDG